MRLFRESTDEAWRLLKLFSSGLTWSAPFLLAAFVNANPGVSSHPRLAAAIEAVQWPMLLAAPTAALIGIALVTWLTEGGRRGSLATALGLVGLPLVGAGAFAALGLLGTFAAILGGLLVAGVALLVGLLVTIVALARRNRWLAVVWSVAWLTLSAVTWFAGARTAGGGDDLGSGLLAVLAGSLVLGVSALGALVGFSAPRVVANLRHVSEESAAIDGTI